MSLKFIIADDETLIREGLKAILDWDALGFSLCAEASDGQEALEKTLSLQPDLLVLDIRMPELSGVEVASALRKEGFSGKIIILSGYSDFAHAQRAIELGVEAYILKPVDERLLREAVVKAKEKIEQENILELYYSRNIKDARRMLLTHLLSGNIPVDEASLEGYGLGCDSLPVQLTLVDYSHTTDDMDTLADFWRRICAEPQTDLVVVERQLCLITRTASRISQLVARLPSLNQSMADLGMPQPLIVIGEPVHAYAGLTGHFTEMKQLVRRRFFHMEGTQPVWMRQITDLRAHDGPDVLQPRELAAQLATAILENSPQRVRQLLEGAKRHLRLGSQTVEQTYQLLIDCTLQLTRHLSDTYIRAFLELTDADLIRDIVQCPSLSDVMRMLDNKFTSFCAQIGDANESGVADKVAAYIDHHYRDPLRLETLAEQFGYNPAYLGKTLSRRIGMGFNAYLDKKRMEQAMRMLSRTSMKIPDIAQAVGYPNVEYFYKKFKAHVGTTPKLYREHHAEA